MILAFDDCEIDAVTREVRRAGKPVSVEPKVFDLLLLLASNRERVVARDEVIKRLWHGRAISDAALSTCLKAARRAIGDDGKTQRLIRTLQRRGFHFIGPVTDARAKIARVESPATQAGDARRVNSEVGSIDMRLPRQPSIAVVPFDAMPERNDRLSLAYGLARDITTRLGRARWLFVIARDTALQLLTRDAGEIGTAVGVRYALRGSVQLSGKKVRVNVALMDCSERAEVWSELFDRRVDDIFSIQDEISEAVVCRVESEIELQERRRALLKPLASLDAWSAFHRACWHMDRHTAKDYLQADLAFRRAAALDPGASRVFAGLSAVHRQRAFLELGANREEEIRKAVDFARHSLSLDPNDPQARWAVGRALMLRNEVEPALAEFEMANSLNPSFALSQYSVGFGQAMVGQNALSDKALIRARRLSPIDPMRFAMVATQAFNALMCGDHERAADLAQFAAAEPNAHYHIVAIAAVCSALAARKSGQGKYLQRLLAHHSRYSSADFFRAFPFQRASDIAIWRNGFKLLGLP